MKDYNISIKNEGYVHCKSNFYSAQDCLSGFACYTFTPGINKLMGEIDSGNWAISYLMSMYKHRPKDFILFEKPLVSVNNQTISLDELSENSCYMDKLHPLFFRCSSVKKLVENGLKHNKSGYSSEDIRELFEIDSNRFERPITGMGNKIFPAMAAIGVAHGKEIFCFPWLSNLRFESYHENMTVTLKALEMLGKVVIVPVGKI